MICDTATDPGAAATHLVETVGVQAILGPGRDPEVGAIVPAVTAPAGVLTLSPVATGSPGLADDGLHWSLAGTVGGTGRVFAAMVSDIETTLRANDPTLGKIRVAVVALGDVPSQAFADEVPMERHFNGQSAVDNALDVTSDCAPYGGCFRRIDTGIRPKVRWIMGRGWRSW